MNPADVAQGDDRWAAYLAADPRLRRRTWECWRGMRRRAGNRGGCWPTYASVEVCPSWDASFQKFVRDMGPAPDLSQTIGRHLDHGDYSPGNVSWQTREQQADNLPHARRLTIGEQTLSVRAWAEVRDVDYRRLDSRIRNGQEIEEALAELEHLREQGKAPGYALSRSRYLALRAARRERERQAGRTRHRPGQHTTHGGTGVV